METYCLRERLDCKVKCGSQMHIRVNINGKFGWQCECCQSVFTDDEGLYPLLVRQRRQFNFGQQDDR